MKKGIFSLMMGLLLAFTGVLRADEVTIGDPAGTNTSSYLPTYSMYNYSFTQQIYTADEIGTAGTINSITMWLKNPTSYARNIQIYMKNADASSFATTSSWIPMETADLVGTGTIAVNSSIAPVTFTLSQPFAYDGSNLVICVSDVTGNWSTGAAGVVFAGSQNAALYAYRDGSAYNTTAPGVSGSFTTSRNVVRLDITPGDTPQGSQLSVAPDPVDFGYRPNNCWMRPMVVTVTNDGPATQIFGVDVDNNYFVPSLDEEMAIPFALGRGEYFDINFGWTTAAEGEVNGVLAIDNQNRLANLFDITAYAYEPVEPDVWEMARVVSNPEDYRDTPTTVTLYDNYLLPPTDVEDGNDAVYKVTFDHDVMLNGNVVTVGGIDKAENGKMAVYTQAGIDEVGGPDLENNYTGPTVASSLPMEMTAYPEGLTGTTTVSTLPMYGLYADAYTRSQYVIPATEIAQMAGCPINSLTYYASSTPEPWTGASFQVYLKEVSSTGVSSFIDPATATTVYSGELTVVDNEMVINFATPYQYNGGNLLIGMDCTTTGTYHSCYFKCVSMTGAGMYAYNYSAPTFTSPYTVNYAPTTTFGYMGRSRNRAEEVVFSDDFESGSATGWDIQNKGTYNGWALAASDGHYHYAQGNYAMFDMGTGRGYNNDLYSPSIDLTNATSATLSFDYLNPDYYDDVNSLTVYAYVDGYYYILGEPTAPVESWTTITYDLTPYCGSEVVINFADYFDYGYCTGIDNVVVTAEAGTPGPGPTPVPGDQLITNMTMLPGTYYIAASSTADAWDVILNASELPCPDEITAEANCVEPADDSDGIDPSSVTLKWHLSPYTTEYRLVFGSTYYCENVLVDWTRDLADSYTVTGLFNNTNYFWRIEERNDGCPQGTQGPVWGFTTTFNAPTNLHATNANGNNIYENETLHLAWTPIVDRTFRMYNIYQNGELIGQTPSNPDPNATTTFDVEGLEYNMGGYVFNVTALYDEGESFFSNDLIIAVSGESEVNGHVYEQDVVTGIAGATVTMTGTDEFGRPHTYTFTTDENGYYQGAIYVGEYNGVATCDGYQDVAYDGQIGIIYGEPTDDIDYIMDEVFAPVSQVIAEYYPDPEDPESPYVKVYWGFAPSTMIEDFETGDFSQYEWNIPAQYPFEITTTNPYEGTYCMQSTNYNVASSTSSIDVNVEIPRDGLMSFYKRISCESSWDMAYFYIDGAQVATFTGTSGWGVKEVAVTEGTHNFKWAYTKDGSVNSGEDRFFIDYIDFIHDAQPAQPGWIGYCEDTFEDAIGLTAGGSFMWGIRFPASTMSQYSGYTMTKASVFDCEAYSGKVMIYQGGATAPGTLVSQQDYTCTGSEQMMEINLSTPVVIDPTQDMWIVMNNINGSYPAAFGADTGDANGRFISIDGTEWDDLADVYAAYTWMIRGYVTNGAKGAVLSSNKDVKAIKPEYALSGASWSDLTVNPAQNEPIYVGSAKSADRELLYYRVYRTDCYNDGPYTFENTVVCCCELHDTLYIDVEWPELDPGVYKWGVGCVYGGNRGEEVESAITWANIATNNNSGVKVTRDGDYIYDFENDLQGWNVLDVNVYEGTWLHSDDNLGGYDYSALAHSGTGFALCYSFVDYVGSFDTDSYLYSPQKYGITNNSTLTFWADNANDSYPENFSVCIATADNPTASDFTEIWNGGAKANNGAKAEVRHDGNRYDNWRQHTIDLSAYAGQNVYIAFHDVNYDAYEIWIDDVTISGTGTPGPDPDPSEIQEPRESPIVWSNCLDKDMYLNGGVDITVLLNSADSPEGVEVSFTNLNEGEQELYPVAPVTLDGTGYYAWDTFRRGDYVVSVTNGDAYEPITDTVSIWDATSLRYVMIEIIYGVSDLYVSHTGWAMWGGEGPTPHGDGDEFSEDFEGGLPAGWNVIDGNNDGITWCLTSNIPSTWTYYSGMTLDWYRNGTNAICSGSYVNGFGAVNPDEYLVSPQVTLVNGSTFSFWAAATDASYPADHFGVFVSDNGTDNWTSVQEWTLSAKGNYKAGDRASRDGGGLRLGNWYNYTVDLSAYAGQKYIAIRHFNCYDQYIMCVDDMELTVGAKSGDERHLEGYKVLCTSIDGEPIFSGNTVNPFIQVDTDELVEGENYLCKVAAIYSTGMSDWSEVVWQYKSCENYGEAQDVVAEGQNVSWNYPAGPVPPPPGPGDEFTEGFESGSIPTGWTTIDADGDGHNWTPASVLMAGYLIPAHGGADCITSQSYSSTYGPLTPDNYLVSPQVSIANGSTFSFWACAQDPSYPAEHYGVAISTTGNTNAADFTTIAEWTMTAKEAAEAGAYMSKNGKGTREGNWYQKTVDLSAYAGQQVYIAIRHFNCTDEFYLNVDDAELAINAKSGNRDEYIQYCTETYDGAVGTGGGQVWWANMFPATSLTAYAGQNITKVGQWVSGPDQYGNIYDGTYNVEVYVGGSATAPGTLAASGSMYITGDNDWHDIELNTPVAIDGTQNIWVVFNANGIGYPMCGCAYVGEPNSDLLSLDGSTWEHALDYDLPYTWMIRAFVTGGSPVPPDPTGNVLGAMIFRDGEWIAEVPYPTNSYLDEEETGEHEYCVRIIYNGTNILPDQNEYYSMSCPVCDGEPVGECAPGAPIRGEYVWNNAEDFGALISWGAVPPTPGDTEFTEDFENGLNGWNVLDVVQGEGTWIHSDDNLGGYDYTAYAHSGTGFAMGYSFVDYVGSFNIDSYLYTPQKYSIVNGSTLTFWADNANDMYPENFSVCVATADNPTAADFTQVWAGGAKGGNAAKSDNRHNGIRIDNWRQHTIDLSAYAGQNVYIAFHDVNYDMYEIWIDDVELTVGAKSNRAGELVKYNVYRSADNVEYEFIGSVDAAAGQEYYEYFDATAAGTYYYQVRAEYSDGCESEPAVSEVNASLNYVIVNVTSVAENGEIALYPNPTNGNITIQAQNMNRITVVSVLGQVVYDAEVEGDSQIINMAQFNAGVYMVRIATENGVSTQRVTVVK